METSDWKKKGCFEERLIAQKSSIIHKISSDVSEQKSFYRFIKNPRVDELSILESIYAQSTGSIKEKSLIVIADTSFFVFKNQKNKIKDFTGLDRITKNQFHDYAGLLVHLNMVFDLENHMPYGLSNIEFVSRKEKSRQDKGEKQKHRSEYIEDKESNKWLDGFSQSKQRLSEAKRLVLVADREADIIELLDRLPDKTTDLVIRSNHNRNIINEQQENQKLYDLFDQTKSIGNCLLKVDSKSRKKRIAIMEIKANSVILPWMKWKKVGYKKNDKGVKINVIKIEEHLHKGHKEEPKLQWYLITTLPISTQEQITEVIDIYKKRWLIEEYFKLLKSDGYNLEKTELTKGESIRRLTLYTMKASIKVQQLKAARGETSPLSIKTVFAEHEITFLKKINPTLEGSTVKQKNPHPPESLSFATWIIARLGGWKEFYDPKRPPGTKTIIWGLEKFETMMMAVNLINVS